MASEHGQSGSLRLRNEDQVRSVIGRQVMGFTVKDDSVELVFGGGRLLVVEATPAGLHVHHVGPLPR